MEQFWQVVTGAPWWVYVLFIYLMSIGVKSIQPREVPIKRVVLMPVLFVAWSLFDLYHKVSLGFPSLIPFWILFLALGAYLGVKEVHSWHFHKDRHRKVITIPGNYSTMVLILLIFILKFFWGYFYATRTEVSYWIYFWDTITSSLVTGFFVGRAVVFFKRYHQN